MSIRLICLCCLVLVGGKHAGSDSDQTSNVEKVIPNAGTQEKQPTKNVNHQEALYRVLKADEGGWKRSDVGAPFPVGSEVYCHRDVSRCASGGVDFISNEHTAFCIVENSGSALLRVKCKGDDTSRLMADECCETAAMEDTSVYATPKGLIHYATWGSTQPLTIIVGMKWVEETYQSELLRRYKGVPVPFMYFADWDWNREEKRYNVDSNIPLRVEKSTIYHPPFYRTLLQDQTNDMTDKMALVERVKALGVNIQGGPFLQTWSTIQEALEAVTDPSQRFYIKGINQDYGNGFPVKNWETLDRLSRHSDAIPIVNSADVVVQEEVPDLLHIMGHQIDIKFYMLIHAGRVYMHQNAEVVLSSRSVGESNGDEMHPKVSISKECIHSFVTVGSPEQEKQWMEAILAQIVASLPVMEPVIRHTAEDADGKLFHIFSGKAMIRESNGQALIVSFSEWPVVDWEETFYNNTDCDESTSTMSRQARKILYEEILSVMYGDFFSIVLGLTNTTSITDDSESSLILDGRVREAIGFRITNNAAKSSA